MRIMLLVNIAVALLAVTRPYPAREVLMAMSTSDRHTETPRSASSWPGLSNEQIAQAEAVSPSSSVSQGGWLNYHSPVSGLSFRYPPSLRIEERSPRSFGLPEAQEITDLVGDTPMNPGSVVLRFIVDRGRTNAELAARRITLLKEQYSGSDKPLRSATPIHVDGHEALVKVDCFPTCRWSVNIFQPRNCTILSVLGGADAAYAEPPLRDDSAFPLLTIIETVHFNSST